MTFDMDLSIIPDENLIVSSDKKINLSFDVNDDICLTTESNKEYMMSIISNQEDIDINFDFSGFYTGVYEVTPAIGEQYLHTADKTMLRDVKVNPIPVTRVSAPNNKGYVVIIG